MTLDFTKYAQKGNEFLNRVAAKLHSEDDNARAGRIVRGMFRTLRNQLTVEESMQLLSQLPMALKGVYVDGWIPSKKHVRIRNIDEFASELIKEEGTSSWRDFSNIDEAKASARAVWETLAEYVSLGELEDILAVLPNPLKREFRSWLPEEKY